MTINRKNGRRADELRPVTIDQGFQPQAYSSILISMGNTQVACGVSLEEKVPPFLKGTGSGWITAEYGMLPCSTNTRIQREAARGRSGRTYEIQRLIGRSLRMMVDFKKLGERTLRVDCDVLNADGGTRTASITGAALALQYAIQRMRREGMVEDLPVTPLAAISVGMVDGLPLLDLDYDEDSRADVDANFVMTGNGHFVEMQCTAEGQPLSREEFDKLADLAGHGINSLFSFWQEKA
jgi:ribonuclease PH